MLNLREIFKPKTLDQALDLLKQPGTVPLAGGTGLIASHRRDVHAAVDLSELGLSYIRVQDGAVAIGATTRLAQLAESAELRDLANGVIAQAAQRSASSLLRNQATAAGTIIAEPDGLLAVVLTSLEAQITVLPPDPRTGSQIKIDEFLKTRDHFLMHSLMTEIAIPAASTRRQASIETVARTPRDRPIVSVCAALEVDQDKVCAAAIAMGGVSEVAVRARTAEAYLLGQVLSGDRIERAAQAAFAEHDPPSDFRGSAEYRREMARVLLARALNAIG